MRPLLLVGAGHAHVALVAHAAALRDAGFDIQLVDPGSFWYGGAPARLMRGELGREALRLPLRAFCKANDVRYRCDRALGLDARHRRLWLASGQMQTFDTISLNVGQETPFDDTNVAGSGLQLWRASATYELVQFVQALSERQGGGRVQRIAVYGDGPRATEIVAGLVNGPWRDDLRISWFLPGTRPLPGAPWRVNRRVMALQARHALELIVNTRLSGVEEGAVCSSDGRRFGADHVVIAAGAGAARFAHAGELPAESDGLSVSRRLHSPTDTRIYAAGGCAAMIGRDVMRFSEACEQAQVLARNIVAGARRRPFKSYRPGRAGHVVDMGDGTAVGWRGRLWWQGAALARRRLRRDAEWLALIARFNGHD